MHFEVSRRVRLLGLLTLMAASAGFGCATHYSLPPIDRRDPERLAHIRQQLWPVSLEDGINWGEANRLASCYWMRFCPGCGMVDAAKDRGEYWKARVYTGWIPGPIGDILIHKNTGFISWKNGQTVTNWSQLSD